MAVAEPKVSPGGDSWWRAMRTSPFDPKAYGDPSRKELSQSVTHLTEKVLTNPKICLKSEEENETSVEMNWTSSSQGKRSHQSSPLSSQILPPTSDCKINSPSLNPTIPTQQLATTTLDTGVATDNNQFPIRRTAEMKSASTPQTHTFETLKQSGETPEALIQRLQAAGSREVFLRNQRKDKKETPNTTALGYLDLLRQPLPSESSETKQNPTENQPRALADRDPNLSSTPSLKMTAKSNTKTLPDSRHQAQNQLQDSAKDMMPPEETWTQSHNNVGDGSKQAPASLASGITVLVESGPQSAVDKTSASGHKFQNQGPSRNRWATTAELKAPPLKADSNAEGSDLEDEVDSTGPMRADFGRLIRSRQPAQAGDGLVGWDGKFMPPHAEWELRPQYNNNRPEYITSFDSWLGDVAFRTIAGVSSPNLEFKVLPLEQVSDTANHPDGIGFVPRETTLHPDNKHRYGHLLVTPLPVPPADFDGDAKLDLSDPDNVRYQHETAALYIERHMAKIRQDRKEAEERARLQRDAEEEQRAAIAAQQAAEAEMVKKRPAAKKNIYLRPAVEADAPGMMAILNWHVENGIRPAELSPITEDDMCVRIRFSQQGHLPVIVAVERTRKTSHARTRRHPRVNPNHPIQNTDPEYLGVTRDEPIVGWASAADWSANDYVETIVAELELYVAASHRQEGVGSCLMDVLLAATDRGHARQGGYDFRVAPEVSHMFSAGGGRDLHKILFQVRSYNQPMTPQQTERMRRAITGVRQNLDDDELHNSKKDYSKAARLDDREDDYTCWLKDWLESYGFEEEAHLKRHGTKNTRFVDVRYLSKETCWQPAERCIPDYSNGI